MAAFIWAKQNGNWIPVIVDSSGHLQVDALSVANPSNLDLAITALRDAMRGASTKDFSTLEADIEAIKANQAIQLARDVTWIRKYAVVTNGTAIVHTVTTGKAFYLVHAALVVLSPSGANQGGDLFVRDGNDTRIGAILYIRATSATCGSHDSSSFPIPLKIPSGWDICASSDITGDASIWGWEE